MSRGVPSPGGTRLGLWWLRRRVLRVVRQPERGASIVEFTVLTVVLLVPLAYLVMMLARLQAGTFAASAASREAGRAFVTADSSEQAEARAQSAARIAFEDQGFDDSGAVDLACDGTPCLRPDGRVTVIATVMVPLPLIPSFARSLIPLEVPVTADHVASVDRFGVAP